MRVRSSKVYLLALAVLAGVSSVGVGIPSASATPGAHPPLLSTSDTRASSVVLTYRQGLGPLTPRMLSYNANFTATSGNFSAQFGAHVLQLRETTEGNMLYGAAATGAAVMSIPLASRFQSGVPRAALLFYGGAAPTAAISGERNFLNVPIGIGVGASLSPAPWLSITPWLEAAPGVDLDTTIHDPDLSEYEPDENDIQDVINGEEAVVFTEDDLRDVIADSIEMDVAFEIPMRAGLDVTARLSEKWSVNVNGYLTSLGSAFGGTKLVYLGAGLAFHWDDVVPSVLPPHKRLLDESCEDIETRFRMCPAGRVPASVNALPTSAPNAASSPAWTSPEPASNVTSTAGEDAEAPPHSNTLPDAALPTDSAPPDNAAQPDSAALPEPAGSAPLQPQLPTAEPAPSNNSGVTPSEAPAPLPNPTSPY